MAKEKFLLISLNEKKSKELAQAISNETCRKILDYLADKEATESELSEKLSIPISTVHYNLLQLKKGGLVLSEEYHYSEKGKEVNHYKLANKYIIIAPKTIYGIKEKLRSILPAVLITAGAAAIIQLFSRFLLSDAGRSGAQVISETSSLSDLALKSASEESLAVAAEAAANMQPISDSIGYTAQPNISLLSNIALWFFIGAVSALILLLAVEWIRNRNKEK